MDQDFFERMEEAFNRIEDLLTTADDTCKPPTKFAKIMRICLESKALVKEQKELGKRTDQCEGCQQ